MRESRAEAAGVGFVALVAAVSVAQSWRQWLDPIVDAGRDLYIPEQLAHGARLYRDYRYNYPPAAPELLAMVVRIFGSSLVVYEIAGALLGIATATALYALTRRVAGVAPAAAVTALFFALNFAGRPGFNFFFPYAHAMTIGIAALMWFLYGVIVRRPALAIAFGTLACWTKLEFALAVVGVVIVSRFAWRGLLIANALVLPLALWRYGSALAENVLPLSLLGGSPATHFYRGLAVAQSFTPLVTGAIVLSGLAALVRWRNLPLAWLAFPLGIAMIPDMLLQPWAIAHVALAPFAFLPRWRGGPLPVLWIASAVTTLRIALNLSTTLGGFAYLVPTYALMAFVLCEMIGARTMWAALIAGVAVRGVVDSRMPPAPALQTACGEFRDARAHVIGAFLREMDALPQGDMVVFPEGVSLNWLARRHEPLREYLFTPPEAAERDVLAELQRARPRYVVMVTRDVSEFGSRGFGIDYDVALARFLTTRYAEVRAWREGRFAIVLREVRP